MLDLKLKTISFRDFYAVYSLPYHFCPFRFFFVFLLEVRPDLCGYLITLNYYILSSSSLFSHSRVLEPMLRILNWGMGYGWLPLTLNDARLRGGEGSLSFLLRLNLERLFLMMRGYDSSYMSAIIIFSGRRIFDRLGNEFKKAIKIDGMMPMSTSKGTKLLWTFFEFIM